MHTSDIDFSRHRRLRSSASMRAMVRETQLTANDLIYPLFVMEGDNIKNEVPSMPGVYQLSLDHLQAEMEQIQTLGVQAVMLFGIPKEKYAEGTDTYDDSVIIQSATRFLKSRLPPLLEIA